MLWCSLSKFFTRFLAAIKRSWHSIKAYAFSTRLWLGSWSARILDCRNSRAPLTKVGSAFMVNDPGLPARGVYCTLSAHTEHFTQVPEALPPLMEGVCLPLHGQHDTSDLGS